MTAGGRRSITISIRQSVDVTQHVAAFDDACQMLRNSRLIVVAECACRREKGDSAERAEIPREVCFLFGAMARYYLDHQMGREVEPEEAVAILKTARDAGLVSQPATARNPGGICNCRTDWCEVLAGLKNQPRPAEMVSAKYAAKVDAHCCTACGSCLERCQMEAIEISPAGAACVSGGRCIGCGLCAAACPAGALQMILR
jgi:NAD-dependent dihydropyrimidine dehydrogenase PreA subunit